MGGVVVLVLYTVGGFLIAPVVIKSQATKIIKAQTGLTAEIGKIRVNPYALSLTLEGFSAAPAGEPDWITLDRMYANAQISSLFRSDYVVKEIRLDSPALLVQWNETGKINLLTILDNLPKSTNSEPFEIPGLRIGQMSISNAAVRWQDHFLAKDFESNIDDVDLVLTNFHSLGTNEFYFGATLDVETEISAGGTFSIEPITAQLHARVDALLLERYAAYIPEWSPLKLTGGHVNTSIDAAAAFAGGSLSATVSNGNVQVAELALVTVEDSLAVFEIDDVGISGAGADLESFSASITDVSVSGVRLLASRLKDGSIDWLQRLETVTANLPASSTTAPKEPLQIPSVRISQMSLSNTGIRWRDHFFGEPFESNIENIAVALTNFHSLGTNTFELGATLDQDTRITSGGTFSIEPITANVHTDVDGLMLERYTAYLPEWSPLNLTGGRVNTSVDASAAFVDGDLTATVANGNVNVAELALITREGSQAVLELDEVNVAGAGADWESRSAKIQDVTVNGVRLQASRLKDGSIDWLKRVELILENLPKSTNSEPSEPFDWSIGRFSANQANLVVTDHVVEGPVKLEVRNASVSVSNLNPDFSGQFPVEVGFELASGGSGTIAGNITPIPLSAEVNVKVDDLFFPIGQPYMHDVLRLQLKEGTVSVDGEATVSLNETNALKAFYFGDIGVDNVVVHEENDLPFATVHSVRVDDLEVDWPLDDFKVQSVVVDAPSAHIYLREDGTANVEEMVPQSITEQIYHQLNEAWKLLQFEVAHAVVTNGHIHVEDRSVDPHMNRHVTNLFVVLDGLTPEATQPATLIVGGIVDPQGPFSVVSEFLPSSTNLSAKVEVNAQMVALSPTSPYAGKFLGHLIDSGNVSVELRYELNGDLVKGENRVIVREFEFGEETGSEEAVSLPVKLGVTLLKDPAGNIDLDVPVEGDLRDPEFKLGKVIWSTFSNIFKRAATAPFKFLGKLVGAGDDEDLSSLEFAAGANQLTETEKQKALKLSKALKERPQLRLEIVGRYDPTADTEKLRGQMFEKTLEELKSQIPADPELQKLARAYSDPGNLDRDELIQLFYVKTFGVNYNTPEKPPSDLIARKALENWTTTRATDELVRLSTNETVSAKSGSFWKKTKDVITLGPLTNARDKEDELEDTQTITPETSETARIIVIDEPIPVLPALPSIEEMEAELVRKISIDENLLLELANARAESVLAFFTSEAGIAAERLKLSNELSGPEPAMQEARVFLGIY